MGQLNNNFKQFLNLLYLYFVCFYIFPTVVVSFPKPATADVWIVCAVFNATIDLMHLEK